MAETGPTLLSENPRSRRTLVRMALMYTPSALVAAGIGGVALLNLLNGSFGAIVGVLILGMIAFATGFQALTALRDLRATPVTTRGVVDRRWDKGTVLWMSRAYYVLVRSTLPGDPTQTNRQVFVISLEAYLTVAEGTSVIVEHWPHTHTIIRLSAAPSPPPVARTAPSGDRSRRRNRPTR